MARIDALLKLIDPIYDAATDVGKWEPALAGIARTFGADCAQVAFVDLEFKEVAFTAAYNIGRDLIERYKKAAMIKDPRFPYWQAHPNRAIHCRMTIAEEALHESEFYREVLAPAGVEYAIGAVLTEEGELAARFGLMRGPSKPAWTEEDCRDFDILLPHVKRSLQLHRRLATLDLNQSAAFAALDRIQTGVLVVDRSCHFLFGNEKAKRSMARSGTPLRLRDGALWPTDPGARAELRGAVDLAIERAASGEIIDGKTVVLPGEGETPALSLLVTPLWSNIKRYRLSPLDRPLAVLFMGDGAPFAIPTVETLRRLYGLTRAEAEVARGLAEGASVAEIAARENLSAHTVRSQLKAAFAKTGAKRQSELVRLLLSWPAAADSPDRS